MINYQFGNKYCQQDKQYYVVKIRIDIVEYYFINLYQLYWYYVIESGK